MTSEAADRRRQRARTASGILAGAALVLLFAAPARAVEFEKGRLFGHLDTTISYGVSFRLEDPDSEIIGTANGGTAFSVNGDDGNLNYDTGLLSNVLKVTTEFELEYKNFGLFLRGTGFYDHENEQNDRERKELTDQALRLVGSRAQLLDAYAWYKFRIAGAPAEVRVGEQVVSWGESTFIQNSINVINPVDVNNLRVPGAELREALLPEGLVWGSVSTSTNTSLEVFYAYDWDDTEIDPPGSYFSSNDFVGEGGRTVFLGFGDSPDVPPFPDPSAPDEPFLGVSRVLPDTLPDDDGQYGLAFRWFVPALGETEFGLYYVNYHSRLPTIGGRTGTVEGATTAGTIITAAPPITVAVVTHLTLNPGDIPGAIQAGTIAGVSQGAPQGASTAIAATAALSGGDQAAIGSTTSAFASDAYAKTAGYTIGYPEDIGLFGLSFNTQLGTTGVALQGEVSHRTDVPAQVDDVELLFAALTPINPALALGSPGASQLAGFFDEDYSTQFDTNIPGIVELDVSQIQATTTKIWGNVLGASQAVLVWEGAVTLVDDLPDKSELRLEGPGTYVSGNAWHADPANAAFGAAHVGKPAEDSSHFPDSTSWGYVLAGRLEYNNALGAWNLIPRFAFRHDVNGISPGPGGNFIEDRKAISVGLTGVYQNTWSWDVSYARFYGAGRYNLINDRDFAAANVKYSF